MSFHHQKLDPAGDNSNKRTIMVSGAQLRAARGLLGWSPAVLAKKAGVSEATIRRAEAVNDTPPLRAERLGAIVRALEHGDDNGSVMFLDSADVRSGGAGVRWRRS